jgi:hypothetical protein
MNVFSNILKANQRGSYIHRWIVVVNETRAKFSQSHVKKKLWFVGEKKKKKMSVHGITKIGDIQMDMSRIRRVVDNLLERGWTCHNFRGGGNLLSLDDIAEAGGGGKLYADRFTVTVSYCLRSSARIDVLLNARDRWQPVDIVWHESDFAGVQIERKRLLDILVKWKRPSSSSSSTSSSSSSSDSVSLKKKSKNRQKRAVGSSCSDDDVVDCRDDSDSDDNGDVGAFADDAALDDVIDHNCAVIGELVEALVSMYGRAKMREVAECGNAKMQQEYEMLAHVEGLQCELVETQTRSTITGMTTSYKEVRFLAPVSAFSMRDLLPRSNGVARVLVAYRLDRPQSAPSTELALPPQFGRLLGPVSAPRWNNDDMFVLYEGRVVERLEAAKQRFLARRALVGALAKLFGTPLEYDDEAFTRVAFFVSADSLPLQLAASISFDYPGGTDALSINVASMSHKSSKDPLAAYSRRLTLGSSDDNTAPEALAKIVHDGIFSSHVIAQLKQSMQKLK